MSSRGKSGFSFVSEIVPAGWQRLLEGTAKAAARETGKRRSAAAVLAAVLFSASAGHAGALEDGAAKYHAVAARQIGDSLNDARELQEQAGKGDAEGAKKAWVEAREGWERSEVFAGEVFPDYDSAIDAWPDAKEGFHAIEAKLFSAKADIAAVKPMSAALAENLAKLKAELDKTTLAPQALLNGTTGLAFEIGENKAGGGESPFSGNSLADMRHNVEGIEIAYQTVFAPALREKDAGLAGQITERIESLESMLKIADLKALDQDEFRKASEELTVALQTAGPKLGLEKPKLED
jgi:iron uptake system EfeUOB component EfeO/EfeM